MAIEYKDDRWQYVEADTLELNRLDVQSAIEFGRALERSARREACCRDTVLPPPSPIPRECTDDDDDTLEIPRPAPVPDLGTYGMWVITDTDIDELFELAKKA